MIINHLLSDILGHALDWVEGSLKVTLETIASLDDGLHNLVTLFLGNTWSEWEGSKVTADTNTGGENHLSLLWGEWWAVKSLGGHVSNVGVSWLVTVVVLNDLVEELVEAGVGVL